MEQDLFQTFIGPLLFAMLAGGWAFRHRPEARPRLLLVLVLMFLTAAASQYRHPTQDLFWLLALYLGFLVALMVWPSRSARLGTEG